MLYIICSNPELSEVQTKETSVSWFEREGNDTNQSSTHNGSIRGGNHNLAMQSLISKPQGNPVIIDVNKEAPYIG